MAALAERVKEALHLGPNFEPTSLESEKLMLSDCSDFAPQCRSLERAARQFAKDTAGFLESTADFLTSAPYPRLWRQPGPTMAAEPSHAPVPEAHAALFTAEMHTRLAESVPRTVSAAIESDVVLPLHTWLTAHDTSKERLSRLERLRLEYDGARRRLQAATSKATAEPAATGGVTPPAEGGMAPGAPAAPGTPNPRAEQRVGRQEEELEPIMEAFCAERAALDEHLVWTVTSAAHLKAYAADVAMAMRNSATAHHIPPGLLEPYPTTAAPVDKPAEGGGHGAAAAPAGDPTTPPPLMAPPLEGHSVQPGGAGIGGFLADTFRSVVGAPTGPPGGLKTHEARTASHPTTATPPSSAAAPSAVVAPEPPLDVGDRPPRPYEYHHQHQQQQGEGGAVEAGAAVGGTPGSPVHHECRMPDEAALGLGRRGRALSGDIPPGAVVEPAVTGEAEQQEGPSWPVMAAPTPGTGTEALTGEGAGATGRAAGQEAAAEGGEGGQAEGFGGAVGAIREATAAVVGPAPSDEGLLPFNPTLGAADPPGSHPQVMGDSEATGPGGGAGFYRE